MTETNLTNCFHRLYIDIAGRVARFGVDTFDTR